MSWAIGYDEKWDRDIGYGVPAHCDYPGCGAEIHRGLSYVCGGQPYGGAHGCGLYFCAAHLRTAGAMRDHAQLCARCMRSRAPFAPTPDHPEWVQHQLTHESWAQWRAEHPDIVAKLKAAQETQA